MNRKLSDALLILLLVSIPFFGAFQACNEGSTGPVTPPPNNHAPVAAMTVVGLSEGPTPFTVTLDASASSDPDGDSIEFNWLFSDGSTAIGPILEHEFKSSGRHEIRLIVTDEWGAADDEGPIYVYGWGIANSPWPKFAHDERNSGVSPYTGPMMDLDNADSGHAFPRYWRGGQENGHIGGVCVGYDNKVVYAQGTWLRARSADGTVLWDLDVGDEITAWPAIAYDGSIIVGTAAGRVHRVTQDGAIIWSVDLVQTIHETVILDSAVNIDHDRRIYIGGYVLPLGDDLSSCGRLLAFDFDGTLLWSKVIPFYEHNFSKTRRVYGRLVPAITLQGNIVVNGRPGQMFSPDGTQVAQFELYGYPAEPIEPLGPPSVCANGYITFAHPNIPLFLSDGTYIGPQSSGGATYNDGPGRSQAPLCDMESVSIAQVDQPGPLYLGLTSRTLAGQPCSLQLDRMPGAAELIGGTARDELGRVYVSCNGLYGISPITYSSVYPHVGRYSLWTYRTIMSVGSSMNHMTAPVIGDDGWLYVGYGDDILAIGN